MKEWRITFFTGKTNVDEIDYKARTLSIGQKLRTYDDGQIELRDSENQIVRLGPNSEFSIEQTQIGVCPIYYGEVYGIYKARNGKYRTSCYIKSSFEEQYSVYMKARSENIDEFIAINGELLIYEFDENNRPYTICTVPENKKVILTFKPEEIGRKRYEPKISGISDDEYSFILRDFQGTQRWK